MHLTTQYLKDHLWTAMNWCFMGISFVSVGVRLLVMGTPKLKPI